MKVKLDIVINGLLGGFIQWDLILHIYRTYPIKIIKYKISLNSIAKNNILVYLFLINLFIEFIIIIFNFFTNSKLTPVIINTLFFIIMVLTRLNLKKIVLLYTVKIRQLRL